MKIYGWAFRWWICKDVPQKCQKQPTSKRASSFSMRKKADNCSFLFTCDTYGFYITEFTPHATACLRLICSILKRFVFSTRFTMYVWIAQCKIHSNTRYAACELRGNLLFACRTTVVSKWLPACFLQKFTQGFRNTGIYSFENTISLGLKVVVSVKQHILIWKNVTDVILA